jgi:hypothetical protein
MKQEVWQFMESFVVKILVIVAAFFVILLDQIL